MCDVLNGLVVGWRMVVSHNNFTITEIAEWRLARVAAVPVHAIAELRVLNICDFCLYMTHSIPPNSSSYMSYA